MKNIEAPWIWKNVQGEKSIVQAIVFTNKQAGKPPGSCVRGDESVRYILDSAQPRKRVRLDPQPLSTPPGVWAGNPVWQGLYTFRPAGCLTADSGVDTLYALGTCQDLVSGRAVRTLVLYFPSIPSPPKHRLNSIGLII